MSEMQPVRMGIIGIGNMGSAHSKNLLAGNVEGMTLGAVCDIAEPKIEWAHKNLEGIPVFTDYKEMIASGKVDAILVATPHYLHPPISIYGLEHGMHVLTEKPAGVYTKQVEEMNEAAKKSDKVFGIMYNQRTNPLYAKAREIVKSGRLGEPKRFVWIITNWYRTQAYYDSGTWRATWAGEGGGVLINQCPHNLDLWQWIFGMPTRIRGFANYGKYHNVEIEDEVTAYAEYANGASAVFITTTGETPGTNRLEITGDRGKIVIDDNKLRFWELQVPEREFCFTSKQSFDTPPYYYNEITASAEPGDHKEIMRNFAAAIHNKEELLAPGEEGINGLTISNAIHLSSWTNDWVELPIDKELYYEKLQERVATSKAKENVVSQISDLSGSYSDRWKVKF